MVGDLLEETLRVHAYHWFQGFDTVHADGVDAPPDGSFEWHESLH